MEGSEGWERIPDLFAAAGDIQAKPTRVSGGLVLLVFFVLFMNRSRSSPRPIRASDIPNCSECCGQKSLPSDFHYVISGLTG